MEPPPECYFKCPRIHTTILETGDIREAETMYAISEYNVADLYSCIVVVETMKWFHKTRIVGDEMSITIGSEFD